jgi:hypothetical protein
MTQTAEERDFSVCPAYWAGDKEKCWRNWYKGCRYKNVSLGTDCFLPEPVWFEPTQWVEMPKPSRADEALGTSGLVP